MKTAYVILVAIVLTFTGCITMVQVDPAIDLDAPFSVSIYDENKQITPTLRDEAVLKEIVRYWLPTMTAVPYTFPSPASRLQLKGKNNEGAYCEMTVFVGQNWIGDGVGYATIADTQVFTLWTIIDRTTSGRSGPGQ